MDNIDKNILECYFENGRISIKALARRINSPQATVHYRIERLKKQGIILPRSIPLINYPLLGYPSCYLFLIRTQRSQTIPKLPSTVVVTKLSYSGYWDEGILVFTALSLQECILIFRTIFKEDLLELENVHLQTISFYSLVLSKRFVKKIVAQYIIPPPKVIELTLIQKKILSAISTDGSIALWEIALKLRISPQRARYHLLELMKNKTLLQIRPQLNITKSLAILLVKLHFADKKSFDNLIAWAKKESCVNACGFGLGKYNVLIQIFYENTLDIVQVIDSLKKTIAENLHLLDLLLCTKEEVVANSEPLYLPASGTK